MQCKDTVRTQHSGNSVSTSSLHRQILHGTGRSGLSCGYGFLPMVGVGCVGRTWLAGRPSLRAHCKARTQAAHHAALLDSAGHRPAISASLYSSLRPTFASISLVFTVSQAAGTCSFFARAGRALEGRPESHLALERTLRSCAAVQGAGCLRPGLWHGI